MKHINGLDIKQQEIADTLWQEGKTDQEIGEVLGLHFMKIVRWRKDNELPSNVGIFEWGEENAQSQAS